MIVVSEDATVRQECLPLWAYIVTEEFGGGKQDKNVKCLTIQNTHTITHLQNQNSDKNNDGGGILRREW